MKDIRIQQAYENGFSYEKTYRGCAQCTVAAIQDALSIINDDVFRASSSLASGGGLLCDGSCGGFSGGSMMISLILGRRREFFDDDSDFKYTAFRLTRDLQAKFMQKYGSVICKDIHREIFGRTYDLLDPEDKQQFDDDGAHRDKCTSVVADAAAWTVEILLQEAQVRDTTLEVLYESRTG
jgi:C_GCAxxG_C_C family probable redox protein